MIMKIIGSSVLLLGLIMIVFALMAYAELNTAATSETAPTPDTMPLSKIVIPEFFDPGQTQMKPTALARIAFRRIYLIGGCAFLAAVLGVVLIALSGKKKS